MSCGGRPLWLALLPTPLLSTSHHERAASSFLPSSLPLFQMAATRTAYQGSKRKLVIAMDLGTTFSGVSYVVLDPGKVPDIKTVNRYAHAS